MGDRITVERKSGKKQMILLVGSSIVLVALAAYRLSSPDAEPASAEAYPIFLPNDVQQAGDAFSDMDPDFKESWTLPRLAEMTVHSSAEFEPPAHNPFVLSEKIRLIVSGEFGEIAESIDEGGSLPSVEVRSTFAIGGVWMAEIDGLTYRTGDSVRGYRITRITHDAVWIRGVQDGDSGIKVHDSAERRPTCLVTINGITTGAFNGRWYAPGRETTSGVVLKVSEEGVEFAPLFQAGVTGIHPNDVEVRIRDAQ